METLCCRRSWLGAVLGHFISEIIFPVQSFAVRSVGNFWGLEIGKNIAWGCRVFRRVCRWSTAALTSIVELLWDPRRFRSVSTGLYPKSTKGLSWTVLFSHWWIFGDRLSSLVCLCVSMPIDADWILTLPNFLQLMHLIWSRDFYIQTSVWRGTKASLPGHTYHWSQRVTWDNSEEKELAPEIYNAENRSGVELCCRACFQIERNRCIFIWRW